MHTKETSSTNSKLLNITTRTLKKGSFQVGDLALRELVASMMAKQGKLEPNWEGPYKVTEVIRPGTYKLVGEDGSSIKNTWHATRLRRFYQ